jgi:hypothetical protein
MMVKFSRDQDLGSLNVHEMQTLWFEVQCSKAYYRQGQYRDALKQIGYIEKHFDTIFEDCIEFN